MVMEPFRGSSRSIEMLFICPERSKKERRCTYPRGEMLHYLGDEDCMAIFGLNDLNNKITLKNGKSASIRMLLKSIPSFQGMSKPRLFQIVNPNST
jgi:hypothetical protein